MGLQSHLAETKHFLKYKISVINGFSFYEYSNDIKFKIIIFVIVKIMENFVKSLVLSLDIKL